MRSGPHSFSTTLVTATRVGWLKMVENSHSKDEWRAMLPIIFTIALQTIGLVWWTATTTTAFDQRILTLEKNSITTDRIARLETQVGDMYRRFDRFEEKLDRLVDGNNNDRRIPSP